MATLVTYTANSEDWLSFNRQMNITLYNGLQAVTSSVEKPFLKKDIFDIGISNYADNCIIIAPEKKSWDETMEEVLLDRAEAWEKLADL